MSMPVVADVERSKLGVKLACSVGHAAVTSNPMH